MRDPNRCERCGCYWQPEVARQSLVLRLGVVCCRNALACHQRVKIVEALDRVIERGRRRSRAA